VKPLHVGLNLVYWVPDSGGSGTYARELIRAIKAVEPDTRITAWVGQGAPEKLDAGVDWVHLPVRSTGSPAHVTVELLGLGLDARRRGVDVVHGLAYTSPVVAPGVATVVSILDLTWRHQPDSVAWLARSMFGLLSPLCGRTADRVIAISEAVRDDLIATLGLDAAKIEVTPLGVSDTRLAEPVPEPALRARLGIPPDAPILLSVAQISRHKNLTALIEALPHLHDARTVAVITGRETPHLAELQARARELGVAERVFLPGFVEAAELEGLYEAADVFVLPTLLEGFGLPVVEAMRRGVPVACSDIPVLREVAGDAARYFDPHDPRAVAAAIEDPPDPGPGRARAAELTWERTARLTLRAYRRAIASRVVR
jgi:glycosyltransferase involved in cell wall biosynthesis